jgi:hypothetical protein
MKFFIMQKMFTHMANKIGEILDSYIKHLLGPMNMVEVLSFKKLVWNINFFSKNMLNLELWCPKR